MIHLISLSRRLRAYYHGRLKRQISTASVVFLAVAVLAVAFFRAAPALAGSPRVIHLTAFGDSLTAGFGLTSQQAFPACLERLLRAEGFDVRIDNAGVSGDTTAQGLARLDWSIPGTPDGVILELGANDGLRGLSPAEVEANLETIIVTLAGRGIPVLLTGMKAILNMGPDYGRQFAAVFARLAAKHDLVFYPFFLEGVAGVASLNQADGLHPNAAGALEIARRTAPLAKEFIRRIVSRKAP